MNATENGDEPLGEAPEVTHSPVGALLDVADRIGRQTATLNAIRRLHAPYPLTGAEPMCNHCCDELGDSVLWPCDTARILEQMPL